MDGEELKQQEKSGEKGRGDSFRLSDFHREARKRGEHTAALLAEMAESSMDGLRQSVLLLLSLSDSDAASLIDSMEEELRIDFLGEARGIRRVDPVELKGALSRFANLRSRSLGVTGGGLRVSRIMDAMSSEGEAIRNSPFLSDSELFGFLKGADPYDIHGFLGQKHPGLETVIMAFLPEKEAAALLTVQNYKDWVNIITRVATSSGLPRTSLQALHRILRREWRNYIKTKSPDYGGVEFASRILLELSPEVESQLLDELEEADPELAEEFKKFLFPFEDIVILGDPDIKKLLRRLDPETLARSLLSEKVDIKEKLFRNMEEGELASLQERMAACIEGMDLSGIMNARREVRAIVREMLEAGEISTDMNCEGFLVV